MSTQIVQHKSRDFDVVLNFPETENTLSWSFKAENDGEIYAVDLVNVASYQIAGAPIALPYAVTAGSSYSVSIVKQTNGLPATISFNTRRAVTKTLSISVPDFGLYTGRNLYVSAGANLFKIDSELLKALNYAGSGAWAQPPILNTYTFPDISAELNYSGAPGTIFWRSICFVVKNGEKYIFCYASNNTTNDEVCSLFKISDSKFYKLDLSAEGYTRTFTGPGNQNVAGGISYNYLNGSVVVRRTRGAGSSVVYFDSNFSRTSFGFETVPDLIFHGGDGGQAWTNRKHNIDPITGEFCTHLSRIIMPSQANRNYMKTTNSDSKYIKSNGYIVTNNGGIILQRRFYNSSGQLVSTFGGTGTATGTSGAICVSEPNNWMFGCSSNSTGIWRNSINNLTAGFNYNLTIGTTDHNGFRGCISSDYSGLAFAWGLSGRNSGKRLYVFDPYKIDASIEVGYLDFTDEINDIYTDQLL